MDASLIISKVIVHILMCCAVLGGVSSIFNNKRGIGKEFTDGVNAIGPVFIPIAGVMSTVPFLSAFIKGILGPIFRLIQSDPSIAATVVIATDMGGYQLGHAVAGSLEDWIMSTIVGYMSGATFVFTIPMGLLMLEKKDHKYFTLGILSGLLGMPFGVLTSCAILAASKPMIRSTVSATSAPDHMLDLTFTTIGKNIWPLALFAVTVVLLLWFFTSSMTKGFLGFGFLLNFLIQIAFIVCIFELITNGTLQYIFSGWGFDPIIADSLDPFRALEVAGLIGIMLAGGYPFIFLLRTYLSKPIERCGAKIKLGAIGTLGLLASLTNVLVMFLLVKDMDPREKVINVAFAVCGAFLIGDHLAFNLNVQPSITVALICGVISIAIAHVLCMKRLTGIQLIRVAVLAYQLSEIQSSFEGNAPIELVKVKSSDNLALSSSTVEIPKQSQAEVPQEQPTLWESIQRFYGLCILCQLDTAYHKVRAKARFPIAFKQLHQLSVISNPLFEGSGTSSITPSPVSSAQSSPRNSVSNDIDMEEIKVTTSSSNQSFDQMDSYV